MKATYKSPKTEVCEVTIISHLMENSGEISGDDAMGNQTSFDFNEEDEEPSSNDLWSNGLWEDDLQTAFVL